MTFGPRGQRWRWRMQPAAPWRLLAGLAWLLCCMPLHAQMLDEVDQRTQGDNQVVRIRFNSSVQFLQLAPTTTADLYTIRFELLAAEETLLRQATDEVRRLPASAGLPDIRIGYDPDPSSRIKQLTIRIARPLALSARQGPNARSIELLIPRPPGPGAPAAAPVSPSPAAAPPQRFVVLLQSVPLSQMDRLLPVPKALQDLEVISSQRERDGIAVLEMSVGYFADPQAAEAARRTALARFPEARVVGVAAAVSAPAIGTASTRPDTNEAAELATPEIEREATTLMGQAREALAAGRADTAVALLNQLLKLPPNSQSMQAQESIGRAWERAGSPARARAEYELYLRLYPQGEGAARVGERLTALGGAPGRAGNETAVEAGSARANPARTWAGSLAQYYYGGKAKSKSLVNIATGIDQSTLSKTTESAIVTSVDLTGRLLGQGSETRAVVRGSASNNLISTSHSSDSIGAAYVEHRRGNDGLAVRVGRQSPISGGLLGLFEGVSLVVPVGAGVKLDVMGGVPAGALVSAPSERLFAAVVEADSVFERWGGNLYLLDQSTQGVTNRRAIGTELRYAGERWSLNMLADYDVMFGLLNALSLHGSFQAGSQTTLTLLADDRRAPSLQLTNALISSGAASLKTLLQTRTLAELRSDALATSAIARQLLVSVSRPLGEHWQASMDLRYSAIGALPAVGDFEATPATGGQYSFSTQLTGTNLYSPRDINNFNLSVITTPFFKGMQLSYNNLTGIGGESDITLEPSLRLYAQRDNQEVRLVRLGPGMRLSYRATQRASLLGELLYEISRTDGPTNHDNSNSVFFYVGYRYELF